jgi:hypothetical protein
MPELGRKLVIPVGREGSRMQIAVVESFSTAHAQCLDCYDREYATVKLDDGAYTISSACEAEASEYALVDEILKRKNGAA